MKTKKNKPKVSELKKQGFKRTSIKGLYITNTGKGFNINTGNVLKETNGKISFNKKAYNAAKLVLEAFLKTPLRGGYINFKNGNKKDFHYLNLEYKTTINQYAPKEADLIKCIRLYFNVDKDFHSKSLLFKYYIYQVSLIRGFDIRTKKTKGSILFFDWLNVGINGKNKNIYHLSIKHGFTATNGKNEVYKYYNLLVNEVLEDYKKGILKVKDFYIPVRKKSFKQQKKDFDNFSEKIRNM